VFLRWSDESFFCLFCFFSIEAKHGMREREKTSNENNEMIPKTTPFHTPKVIMSVQSVLS
jgi:hypothetical protein